jgi:hypothetical protein
LIVARSLNQQDAAVFQYGGDGSSPQSHHASHINSNRPTKPSPKPPQELTTQPPQPSTFTHYISHFLVSKKWHDEALQIFLTCSEFDLTRRNRIFNFISPYASLSGIYNIRIPLPYLENLTAIRVRMSEILCAGVGLLSKACPHLGRIELHAEARDFEGEWFDEVVAAAAADTGYTTRRAKKENETNSSSSNETNHFLSSLSEMTSTFASRRFARIWRESLTAEFLLRTRWYAEITQLSGLQEATLMLTQTRWFWEGHTPAEETNFSFNLWKIRWVFLLSATRPKWGRSDLLHSLGDHEIGNESEEREQEGGDLVEYGPPERKDVTARL